MSEKHLDLQGSDIASAHAWLLALARGLVRDEARAEDLVQDAWVSLARRGLATVRDWRGFLGGVVRIRARRERVDARARTTREERSAPHEELPSADQLAARLELARAVVEELARLPAEQRVLLQLRYQEGLEPAAIARRRGVPAGTLRSQLARAREALRERLDARTHGRREAWAAIAALPLARESVPFTIGALAGGLAMSVAAKLVLGLGVAAAIAWWVWSPGTLMDPTTKVASTSRAQQQLASSAPEPETNDALVTDGRIPVVEASVATDQEPREVGNEDGDVVLRVTDSVTGEALPDYAVAIHVGETEELVTTGTDGTAMLASKWFAAPFQLIAVDDPEDRIDRSQLLDLRPEDRPAAGADLEFEVLAGPTYHFLFDTPPPHEEDVFADVTQGNEPSREFSQFGRLRPGSPAWSRLDPTHANPAQLGEGPWTVTVHDGQGYWLAWGPVQQIEGAQAAPVVMQSSERGALAVTVTVEGSALDSQVGLQVDPIVDGLPSVERGRYESLYPADANRFRGSGGRATIGHLEPGRYRVWVGSLSHEHSEEVEVRAGETLRLAIDLTKDPAFAPLTVILRSQTGNARLGGVSILATRQGGKQQYASARWIQNHPDGSCEYRFEELEAGTWNIDLDDVTQLPPFEPRSASVSPGGEPVVFLCLDEGVPPPVQRAIRLIDASTREPIPFAGTTTFVGGLPHHVQSTEADGTVTLGPYLPGSEVYVLARAEDHRPRFERIPFEAGTTLPVLDVALEQGWGTMLDVIEPCAGKPRGLPLLPLPDVRVLLDGVFVGATDEHGQFLVESDHRPAKIELQREGYRIAYGDIDPETLAPNDRGLYPYFVVMERKP